MIGIDRRGFLETVAAAGAGMALGTPLFGMRPDRAFSTALIGSGWWGMNILRTGVSEGHCRVVGLCDVDESQLSPAREEIRKLTGSLPSGYRDFRELLATEKPEIVIVATPDHWHALQTIAAVESGAHVYVEKPVGHTLREGRAMVNAARRHERVVQVGTHRRVSPHNVSGMKFLKSGRAGKIGMVRAFVYYGADSPREKVADSQVPSGLDWDLWCGPAPYRPYNRLIHPRGFRSFLDYANGMLGDWGIHWMDQILWWTDERFPKRIFSTGGRTVVRDNTDAPDVQVASFQFEEFTVSWEHRTFGGNPDQKHQVGCYFYGTEGVFHMGWLDGWTFYPRKEGEVVLHEDPQLHQPDSQNILELWRDFISAILSNRRPVSDIEIGHLSSNMSLLGMLSLKLGRSIDWDGIKEVVIGDEEANRLMSRVYRTPWVYPA